MHRPLMSVRCHPQSGVVQKVPGPTTLTPTDKLQLSSNVSIQTTLWWPVVDRVGVPRRARRFSRVLHGASRIRRSPPRN